MIQDISPYRLDTAYRGTAPVPDDCFFSFRGEDVLLRDMGDGHRSLPSFRDLGHPAGKMESRESELICLHGGLRLCRLISAEWRKTLGLIFEIFTEKKKISFPFK